MFIVITISRETLVMIDVQSDGTLWRENLNFSNCALLIILAVTGYRAGEYINVITVLIIYGIIIWYKNVVAIIIGFQSVWQTDKLFPCIIFSAVRQYCD